MQYLGFLSVPGETVGMVQRPGKIRSGRGGSLPFALIAVAILIGASAYCAVAAGVDDAGRRTDNAESEMDRVSEAISGITGFIERGMGENVFCVSTDVSLGDMTQRSEVFEKRMSSWMDTMFPAEDSGVRVTVQSYEIGLEVQDLRMSSGYYAADGYVPAFIKAQGTVEAVFESESGTSHRTLYVVSDGSGALPLSSEAGTMFENILEDGGSVLSQMVSYQLTALAQYRIMNGYGAFAYYGDYGTDSVITEDDVRDAYSRALRAVESIVFRDADGGLMTGRADLAKAMVGDAEGRMQVNVSAVYAQALAAVADGIVGKWFDYFLGNKVLRLCDYVDDTLRNAWDSFTSFITGRNSFSAEPYIEEIVGDTDLGVGRYISMTIPPMDGTDAPPLTVYLDCPEHDLMGSDTVQNFKSYYRDDSNAIREWLYSVVNESIAQAAERKFTGTVVVDLDDSRRFSEVLYDAVTQAMDGASDAFASSMADTVGWHSYPDQFYAAIYDAVYRDRETIFHTDYGEFREKNRDTVFQAVLGHCENYAENRDDALDYAERMCEEAFDIQWNKDRFDEYVAAVDALMDRMEALKSVQSKKSSIIEKGCIGILRGGMLKADGAFDVSGHLAQICSMFSENIGINAAEGFTDLPDRSDFVLTGDGVSTERLKISVVSDPDASVGRPKTADCTHQNGLEDASGANYCTVFPVHLDDRVEYTVTSCGALSELLGISDSVVTGTSYVSMDLDIAAVSGWGLAGVDYEASADILHDLWRQLLKAAEPLLEPLRKALCLAGKTAEALWNVMTEISRYTASYVEELYEKIIAPLETLVSCIKERVNEVLGEKLYEVADGLSAIVDMTLKTQTIGFSYMGFVLKFTTDCASLSKSTKNLLKVEMSGNVGGDDVYAYLDIKLREKTPKTVVTGGIAVEGDGWKVSGTVDPTMTQTKHLFTLSGTFRGTAVDLVMPELVQYREIDIRLSDIPGIGTVLSNIPSPIAGTKIALDVGLDIKYSAPFETGVLINEVESNPEGDDVDNEWAEIINNTAATVDLSGWMLTTGRGRAYLIESAELPPGGRYVAEFEGIFLNNSNERLILMDRDKKIVDEISRFSDRDNDSKTYQRAADCSTEWGMYEGSKGTGNTSGTFGKDGIFMKDVADIMKNAAKRAMGELKHVTDVGGLSDLFTRTMQYALDDGIDRLSSCLVEASVFVSVEIQDITGTGCTGFEVYVKAGKEMAEDALKYLVGRAESMLLDIEDPYGVDLGTAACDDIYLGVTAYTGTAPPKFLPSSTIVRDVTVGLDVACNVSAVRSVLGDEGDGTWNMRAGVVIRGCPNGLIPSGLGADETMDSDLWLMRVSVGPS